MTDEIVYKLAFGLHIEKPGTNWNPNKHVQWDLDCKAVAHVVVMYNKNFSLEQFIALCKGEGDHI